MNIGGSYTRQTTSAYNTYATDNKHIGYMYGGTTSSASTQKNGTVSDAATYNERNSSAKTQVENWYSSSISGKSFESQVKDNLFCNDRATTSGNGYGTSITSYAGYTRLITGKTPTLKCTQKNDRFTVSDTTTGNGNSVYPVGLITADEALMAGSSTFNTSFYLYTGYTYWTMTPSRFASSVANIIWLSTSGGLTAYNVSTQSGGIRPVISIDGNINVTGDGTSTNPFKAI